MNKITGSKGVAAIFAALFCLALEVAATPVPVDGDEKKRTDASALSADRTVIRRSADLGLSTALPLARPDQTVSAAGHGSTESQQPLLVEPGTLILVGLGLITYGVTRQWRIRLRRSRQ